jgi:glucose dehydrogenase
MKRIAALFGFALIVGSLLADPLAQQKGKPKYNTWQQYLGGSDSSQYSSLDQINKKNVGQLQVAWTYSTGDMRTYRFNPIVVDTVMYTLAKNMSISTRQPAKRSGRTRTSRRR